MTFVCLSWEVRSVKSQLFAWKTRILVFQSNIYQWVQYVTLVLSYNPFDFLLFNCNKLKVNVLENGLHWIFIIWLSVRDRGHTLVSLYFLSRVLIDMLVLTLKKINMADSRIGFWNQLSTIETLTKNHDFNSIYLLPMGETIVCFCNQPISFFPQHKKTTFSHHFCT